MKTSSVGYLNPLLYKTLGRGNAFKDVTVGNNDMTGQVGGYNAKPGWDAASGFGSPNGAALLAALEGPGKSTKGGTAPAGPKEAPPEE